MNQDIKYYIQKCLIPSIKCVIKPIQHPASISCGLFCMALVLARKKKMSVKKILSFFSHELIKNDKNILKLLEYMKEQKT